MEEEKLEAATRNSAERKESISTLRIFRARGSAKLGKVASGSAKQGL